MAAGASVAGGLQACLRAIVAIVPAWVGEEIMSASEHTRDKRAVLWTRFVKLELGR